MVWAESVSGQHGLKGDDDEGEEEGENEGGDLIFPEQHGLKASYPPRRCLRLVPLEARGGRSPLRYWRRAAVAWSVASNGEMEANGAMAAEAARSE